MAKVVRPEASRMAQPSCESDAEVTLRTMSDPAVRHMFKQDWQTSWRAFIRDTDNKDWWEKLKGNEKHLYCLPEELITAATRRSARRASSNVLEYSEAERSFTKLCTGFNSQCVGTWRGEPIIHALSGPISKSESAAEGLEFSKKTEAEFQAAVKIADEKEFRIQRVLRFRAGQLFSMNQFARELRQLQSDWNALKQRPNFPLARLTKVESPDNQLCGMTEKFLQRLRIFLDRWELTSIDSWQLIVPLGPLALAPLDLRLNSLGKVEISNLYPHYWPATLPQTSLIARIELPEQAATGPITIRIENEPSIFERAYEMRLAEIALGQRCQESKRGVSTRVSYAFATRFKISEKRIQQIREKYSQNVF